MGIKRLPFKNRALVLSLLALPILLAACELRENKTIGIVDAKVATAIDEKLLPVNITSVFPEGSTKVFCWFQWKDAKIGTLITAKWHYVTDDINILDYAFAIPRKEGSGSVSLSMPENKKLPSGLYRVDLALGNNTLGSVNFKVK